jgi:NAD(P)-dependent dehydrogenase (short-subunit alcohol dehydrogenase family)
LLGGAKAALDALTRSRAVELGPQWVAANTSVPGGPVFTDSRVRYLNGQEPVRALLIDHAPVCWLCTPADIAEVAALLISRRPRWSPIK